ncbi:Inhibitor of growth protein 3 [Cyphellophora attinorum]|uniref:Inhibitor of growth protein 3 n=1 Tax=Cyphellophora attinorum TaxID=1664694 RepID=A0A0N0NQQ4_9EURO|nr:Inhibitor of growth protein 3 [Phialophora attinorum]KPI44178.1 Inhibitor of growth protein 3 [Phialophora attinorum]
MVDIVGERAVDPDAQAAVTDFLDYTEYLPSDLIRSLRLIQGLDDEYNKHADSLHDLTRLYGSLPSVEPTMRPDAAVLRRQIIGTLDSALDARESAAAEASRLFDVADRHQNRLKSIIAKLNAIPKPPSRDPTPQPPTSNKKISKSGREIKPATTRLTLNPPRSGNGLLGRPRGRRVTVPGEVLPPYDPDEAIASTEVSDWESPPPPSPPRPMLKLKQPKLLKDRDRSDPIERVARASREGSTFKKPTPPPEDAEPGSKWKPWTHLTEYEMYKLRKKMKKNNTWDPSPVMIRRELESRGRGWENYFRAKETAEANGTPFNYIEGPKQPKVEKPEAESPVITVASEAKPKSTTKADKKKKEKSVPVPARTEAAKAAQETELAARRLGNMGSLFKDIFSPLQTAFAHIGRSASSPTVPTTTTTRKQADKTSKKRKLDEAGVSASPSAEPDQRKRQKTAPAKPSPLLPAAQPTEPRPSAGTIKIPLNLNVAPLESSSTESSDEASSEETSSQANSTAEASVAPKMEQSTPPPPVTSRPVSRKSTAPPAERGESMAVPVAATRASSRIASATPAAPDRRTPSISLRMTPAAEPSPKGLPTAASRRTKREVPGTVKQTNQHGGAAVLVSKRQSKPVKQKKAAVDPSPASAEVRVDIDGRLEVVDPNEERYCICGDVSYGEMICCELDPECEFGTWFHMDCVELAEMPGRTTKWYCPGDRKKYHKGENTNGLVGRGIRP